MKKSNQPFFSVVIPLFNKEAYILETLDSVFKQSFKDFEIILINDGSTDNSCEIVSKLINYRIRVINQSNQGVSVARNKGIKEAKGIYVALLDADDYWYPNHLQNLFDKINIFKNEKIFCTNYAKESFNKILKNTQFGYLPPLKNESYLITNYFRSSLKNDIACSSSICIEKEFLFSKNILFDTTMLTTEDLDMWLRLGMENNFVLIAEITAIHKKRRDNSLSNCNNIDNKCFFIQKNKQYEKLNPYLKAYLDQNRFSVAMQYFVINERDKAKKLLKEINQQNLRVKRRVLMKLPYWIIKKLKKDTS